MFRMGRINWFLQQSLQHIQSYVEENKMGIENVVMPKEGYYKFVVVDTETVDGSEPVFVAGPGGYHSDVLGNYEAGLPEDTKTGYVHGGGRVDISESKIHAFGYSVGFGKAPQILVEELLRDYVKDKNIDVEVSMGSGY
jgi:hypothetical protein